ncbi:MAG: phage DNA encapsidation protein [Clostridiales bacterium]|nr:phage DNA encapsidation protein [Clostridiales bacterium]
MDIVNKRKKKKDDGYYHIEDLLTAYPGCKYYMVYSLRSNGKSYSVLEYILKRYLEGKGQGAIIRRYDMDFKNKRGGAMFAPLIENGLIELYSAGRYNGVKYMAGEFTLYHRNEEGEVDLVDSTPFCYGFSLTGNEHDKSTGYPNVTTIFFDEFIARDGYLVDEFVLLCGQISTIFRRKSEDRIVIMCGNTINPYNPYFEEMGITHARKQKPGTVDIYEYGESGLKVCCQYAEKPTEKYDSDVFFAFNNPKLHMITDGQWELSIYPHCPIKYRPKDIKFVYFIRFKENLLQAEVVMQGPHNFTYIHKKTTELQDPEHDLVFDTQENSLYSYGRRMTAPANGIQQKIAWYFKADKVFYQDNLTGEIVRNYIEWCNKH